MSVSEQSRVEWMSTTGKQIYGEWADALLDGCAAQGTHEAYLDRMLNTNLFGIRDGAILSPDEALNPNITPFIKRVDADYKLTEQILLPHQDEIFHYTSAEDFVKVPGKDPARYVVKHALDGLKFALFFPVGVANDVFLEHQMTEDPFEASVTKLQFLANALGSESLRQCVDAMAITGFDFWGDLSTIIEKKEQDSDNTLYHFGWTYRATAVGHSTEGQPTAVVDYNTDNQSFSVSPDVCKAARHYLRSQNFTGLSEKAAETAGNLGQLTEGAAPGEHRRFSRGCPVAGTPSMQKATEFSAKVLAAYVDYYNT